MLEASEISHNTGIHILDCLGEDQRRYIATVLARHGLRDDGVIEEITQETFLRLLANDGHLHFPSIHHLHSWFARTALNYWRDTQRDYGREQERLEPSYELWMRPRDQFQVIEAHDELRSLFQDAAISPLDQTLLMLTEGEGWSVDETLAVIGLPRTSFFNHKRSAMKRLRIAAGITDNLSPGD